MSDQESLQAFIQFTLDLDKTFAKKIAFSEHLVSELPFATLNAKILHEMEACETARKKAKEGLLSLVIDLPAQAPKSKGCLLGAIFYLQISIEEEFDLSKKIRSLSDSFKGMAYSSFSSSLSSIRHSVTPPRAGREEATVKSRLYQSLQRIIPRRSLSTYTQWYALLDFKEAMLAAMPSGQKRCEEYDYFGEKHYSEEEKPSLEKKFIESLEGVIQSVRKRCVHFSAIFFLQSIAKQIKSSMEKLSETCEDEGEKSYSFKVYFRVLYGAYLLMMEECIMDIHYLAQSSTKILSREFKNILEDILGELIEDTPSVKVKIEAIEVFERYIQSFSTSTEIDRSYFFSFISLNGKVEQLLRFYKEKEGLLPSLPALKEKFEHLEESQETASGFEVLSSF